MAGYHDYSMSNNAVQAYYDGEMPLSKWTKSVIIERIERMSKQGELNLICSISNLKKLPTEEIKSICLKRSSWHHTSIHYNATDFYTIAESFLEDLTDSDIEEMLERNNEQKTIKKSSPEPKEERWICRFLEWSGTRKHPKATEVTEEGVIRGNWFYRKNGSKKNINATGFVMIQKVEPFRLPGRSSK